MEQPQPPPYQESLEFEVPNYSNSMEQLQNLPPPIHDEPTLFDAPSNTQNNTTWNNPSDAPTPQTEMQPLVQQNFSGYPSVEVEDKIKDILSRYNPHASPAPTAKEPTPSMDPFRGNETQPNQPQTSPAPSRQQIGNTPSQTLSPPQPRQQYQQAPQQSPAHKAQVQTPPQPLAQQYVNSPPQQQHQYVASPPQPQHQYVASPPQPQLRATVVQNVPSQPTPNQAQNRMVGQQPMYQPPQTQTAPQYPPNVYQMQQPSHQPVHQTPPVQHPPQIQTPTPQQAPVQVAPPQQSYPQVQPPQVAPQPYPQATMPSYQPQTMPNPYLAAQNAQFQQPQIQPPATNGKEVFNQMTAYFDRISSFMEKMDKRLSNLENTANSILKNQKSNSPDELTAFIAKNELDTLRKMQEQMENDFDIAKRMQAEMDSAYIKEKERRTPARTPAPPPPRPQQQSTPAPSSLQECPICGSKVPFLELEYHVNQCLEGDKSSDTSNNGQEKTSFWKRVFGPGPKKEDPSSNNQLVVRTNSVPSKNQPKTPTATPLPTPMATTSMPLYPGNGQEFYQMPFVYRGGPYPPPTVMPYGGYPQQIYYYPQNMAPQNQSGKK